VPSTGVTSVVLYGPGCTFKTLRQVGTESQIQISATAQESGTHYVEIVDVQEGDGDYTMRVDTGSSTATPTPTDTATATPSPTPTDTATATPTPTDTATATPSPTATTVADDYGEQGYGEYGYGGVSN
jgi:cell division septation protein DedD